MTISENGRSLERAAQVNKELLESASRGMVDLVFDLTESMFLKLPPEDLSTMSILELERGASGFSEHRKRLEESVETLNAFINCKFESILARPRQEREDDRVRLLPGQHKGIFISYVTESHDLGYFNIYGGLRDAFSPFEIKDTDVSMQRHHSKRTEAVLSQTVHFNFHVKDHSGKEIFEIWYKFNLGKGFVLDKLKVDGQGEDIMITLGGNDPGYEELKQRLNTHTKTLTSLVPSV